MDRLVAVLFVCLLSFSGCVQPPLADDPTPPEVQDGDLPPGVTTDGISNASRLLDAHVSTLNETGWSAHMEMRFRGPHYSFEGVGLLVDGRTITATPEMVEVRTERRRHFEFTAGSRSAIWHSWYDERRELTKLRCPSGEVVYQIRDSPHHLELLTIRGRPILGWLRMGDYDLTAVDRSRNQTLFTFVANEESARGRIDDREFVNGSVVVDSAGRIHHLESSLRWTTDNGTEVTRRDSYELLEVGVSDLEPPEWAETAKESSTDSGCGTPSTNG